MASIGEKIKGVLTGHSNKESSEVTTPDVNAPGAYPIDEKKVVEGHTNLSKLGHQHRDNEIGAGHVQGRHDPEVDTKEATSQAGNYPYWGDLPRDGEQDHSHQHGKSALGGTHAGDSQSLHKDSGLASGALATGAGAAGIGSRPSEYEHRSLDTQNPTGTTQNLTDRTRDTGVTSSSQVPATTQSTKEDHKGIAAATGAGAAGLAGATYLGNRHKDDETRKTATSGLSSGSTQDHSLNTGYTPQSGSSTTKPQDFTNIASADSPYSTHDNNSHSHRKEEGALAAGAGAAGIGGAGYLAHKRAEDNLRTSEQPTTAYGSQQQSSGLTSSTDNPYANTRGDHSHHKQEGALAAGVGAAGLGGAGYLAHNRAEDPSRADERPTTVHSSQQRDTTSALPSSQPQSTTGGGIHNTVVGAGSAEDAQSRTHKSPFNSSSLNSSNTTTVGPQRGAVDPREQQSISNALGAPNSGHDRENQGLAAAAGVGAGAGAVAAEEKYRHHEHRQHDDKPKDQGHSFFGSSHKHDETSHHDKHAHPAQSSTTSQPSAQLAAQQAWNNQSQGNTATRHDPESEARQATSAAGNYPYQGQGEDRSTTNTGHHHNAALGTAAGAGLAGAGATAAYYGQGREHDQNPRSDKSQSIADRALGSDGAAHAPSSGAGARDTGLTGSSANPQSGLSSAGVGAAGMSGGSALGSSKILHKCHQCGADNDISDYFKKDAGFRIGS